MWQARVEATQQLVRVQKELETTRQLIAKHGLADNHRMQGSEQEHSSEMQSLAGQLEHVQGLLAAEQRFRRVVEGQEQGTTIPFLHVSNFLGQPVMLARHLAATDSP